MVRNRPSIGLPRLVLIVPMIVGAAAADASAGLIAADSYPIGTNPALGQYMANTPLINQSPNLVTPGFVTGPYGGGTGTSQFGAASGGLAYPGPFAPPSATDGRVAYTASALGSGYKSDARSLTAIASPPANNVYFFSALVREDGIASATSGGYVLTGFGNTVQPLPGPTNGFLEGFYVGFAQDTGNANDTGDLILRYRTYDPSPSPAKTSSDAILINGSTTSTVGNTYHVVVELDGNSNGAIDRLTYFVNPTNFTSPTTLAASSIATGSVDTYSFQASSDFARLTYAANNFNAAADFDEVRLGTSLADVTPTAVPEPGTVTLLALGITGVLAARCVRRARS